MSGDPPDQSSPEAAEAAFYDAFARCDLEAMAAAWADDDVVCIHPGSFAVRGRDAVLRSWTSILGDAAAPQLEVVLLRRIDNADLAVHLVEEHIGPAGTGEASVVLATNVYRRYADGWRMVEHHASLPPAPRRRPLQ